MADPDFYVGEYGGDPLVVSMPFNATSYDVTIEIARPLPRGGTVTLSSDITVGATQVSRAFGAGELDVAGRWKGAVIAVKASPAERRVVEFDFYVADPLR